MFIRGPQRIGLVTLGIPIQIRRMASTRHCHQCGWVWELSVQPGRSETCHQCNADMRVCKNCTHYSISHAHQCKERRAEPVHEKDKGNFCEWFELARREFSGGDQDKSREDKARDDLKKLLGDL